MNESAASSRIEFLFVGEAVLDLISKHIVPSLDQAAQFQRYPGGQVSNLAMNLSRLGFQTTLAACVGDDGFGDYLIDQYKSAGVNLDLIQTTTAAPTTLVPITRQTRSPDFIIYRGADQHLQLTDQLRAAITRCTGFHTSAFSLARDPARKTIMECLRLAHRQEKLISFDPNFHPQTWPEQPPIKQLFKEILSLVDIIKPSLDDCARIFGRGRSPDEYLERFLALGPRIVALTMGREGALIGTAEGQRWQIKPDTTDVVDVTGAGDAFWSGLLAGLAQGLPASHAARLGQVIASHKITAPGPVTGFPSLEYFKNKAHHVDIVSRNNP